MQRTVGLTGAEFKQLKPIRRVHGRLFSLLVGELPSGHARCACVVSKKASARAVVRNSIKRRCREVLRKQCSNIKKSLTDDVGRAKCKSSAFAFPSRGARNPAGFTLVFHAKASAAGASYADIAEDVHTLIMRATMS